MVRAAVWKQHGESFEAMANKEINETRSDNLLYVLLTIPGQRSSPDIRSRSVLDIALDQRRLNFLNDERVANVVKYVKCIMHIAV